MVTSALPQEGKSVFASGLARNAAAAGWRVILMECDFGCPSLAGHFNLPLGPGLCEILSGNLLGDSSSAIHEPEPRLHVVVAGRTSGDPQELLASNRMSEMLADLRTRYDLIVLEQPPVLPVADALVLARQADATLMVVRWEKTASAAAQDALRLLRESHDRLGSGHDQNPYAHSSKSWRPPLSCVPSLRQLPRCTRQPDLTRMEDQSFRQRDHAITSLASSRIADLSEENWAGRWRAGCAA